MADTATTVTTLASRAASLLSKTASLAIVEKALNQAIQAKRVYPALATDFSEQLGVELPLKTRDFVAVVGHLLAASEKPIKGVVSKRKSEILAVLSELVGALTDTQPIALPSWAVPKERTKKEAEAVDAEGALSRANAEAEANAQAEALAMQAASAAAEAKAEAKDDTDLSKALAVIVARVGELSEAQREMIRAALEASEPAML